MSEISLFVPSAEGFSKFEKQNQSIVPNKIELTVLARVKASASSNQELTQSQSLFQRSCEVNKVAFTAYLFWVYEQIAQDKIQEIDLKTLDGFKVAHKKETHSLFLSYLDFLQKGRGKNNDLQNQLLELLSKQPKDFNTPPGDDLKSYFSYGFITFIFMNYAKSLYELQVAMKASSQCQAAELKAEFYLHTTCLLLFLLAGLAFITTCMK